MSKSPKTSDKAAAPAKEAPGGASAGASDGKVSAPGEGMPAEASVGVEQKSILDSSYFWLSLGILVALAVAVGGFLWWRRRRNAAAARAKSEEAPKVELSPEQKSRQEALPRLFRAELARLRKNSTGRDYLYRIPWCAVVGGSAVGQSTVIQNAGLHSPFTSEDEVLADATGCRFHYFDQGIVLDVKGPLWDDASSFEAFLGELRRARPRRPLDSVLLLIPATDLFGPTRLDAEGARLRGEELYQKVQQLQRSLGLRVPIYCLITKCDLLPGFVAYSNSLSAAHRAQLLGWSNAQELTQAYEPELVTAAFAQIYQAQCQQQLDLLASGRLSESEGADVFLLPRHINELCEPLRHILDQIFRATVYSEPTLLRGIYLCGDSSTPTALGAAQDVALRRPAFLNHLFAKKMFPEFGLSRPLARGALSAQNLILLVKVAVAVTTLLCLGILWVAAARLQRDTAAVVDFIEKIPRKNSIQESGLPERERYAKQSERLLNAMAQVPARSLRSLALPTSWLSAIDDEVHELILQSFESVILSGIRSGLEYKATQLFGLDSNVAAALNDPNYEPPPEGEVDPRMAQPLRRERPNAPPKVLAFANMPEYLELRALGSNYTEFGQYVELYNRLGSDRRKHMDTVPPLVKYVFRIELGDDFNKNRAFYEEALENATVRAFDLKPVTSKATRKTRLCRNTATDRPIRQVPR